MELLSPREKNQIEGMRGFREAWQARELRRNPDELMLPASPYGNVNLSAAPFAAESLLLARGHNRFLASIEPGVRDWVLYVVERMELVTYTSCEGHFYAERGAGDERHVGVLPRSVAERDRIIAHFENAERDLHARSGPGRPCQLALMIHTVGTDVGEVDALDIFLCRAADASWAEYFAALEADYDDLMDVLRKMSGFLGASG